MWKVTNLVWAINGLRSGSPWADVPERYGTANDDLQSVQPLA
jgi:hypothetical protein